MDTEYYHPGYRDANAGENAFDEKGNYIPSLGDYSSRLPQPGRYILANLKLSF